VTAVGVYNVEATVTDQNYVTQTVKALFVIYDANGSFVTGGGWINSPEGACKLTATARGGGQGQFRVRLEVPAWRQGAERQHGVPVPRW
jgi:hypothetical protein